MGQIMSEDSFFSRWSRRKALVREGLTPDEPVREIASAAASPEAELGKAVPADPQAVDSPTPGQAAAQAEPAAPPPTLEDVAQLTTESDFSPFVARHVPSEVRNAAVKKLFADPHFNVMDGLDIYIDDYTKPSPLSAAQMAKMVGAQFLKLVDDPNAARTDAPASPQMQTQAATAAAAEEPQKPPTDQPVLQARPEETAHDDHADLQLQPDDAPEPQGPGGRAG
jgi:hypothetical protein